MELKKQKLLLMLQPMEGDEEGGVATALQPSNSEGEKEQESGEDVVGMKCRAPLKEVWVRPLTSHSHSSHIIIVIVHSPGVQWTTTMLWYSALSLHLRLMQRVRKMKSRLMYERCWFYTCNWLSGNGSLCYVVHRSVFCSLSLSTVVWSLAPSSWRASVSFLKRIASFLMV